jgi:hypothetical protein
MISRSRLQIRHPAGPWNLLTCLQWDNVGQHQHLEELDLHLQPPPPKHVTGRLRIRWIPGPDRIWPRNLLFCPTIYPSANSGKDPYPYVHNKNKSRQYFTRDANEEKHRDTTLRQKTELARKICFRENIAPRAEALFRVETI